MLMCGWRRDVRDTLLLYEDLAAPGSEIHIMCGLDLEERLGILEDAGLDIDALQNVKLINHIGHARRHYQKLPWPFTSCLVVSDEEQEDDPITSDSTGITTTLMVRDIQMQMEGLNKDDPEDYQEMAARCPVLVEILDARTEASVALSPSLNRLAQFVQRNEMVSRVLAMVSEEASVNHILGEVLCGDGCAIEVQPADRYINRGEQLSFMQLSLRVMEADECCIGYQKHPPQELEDTVINPRDKDTPMDFAGMYLIVMRGPPLHPELHN